MGRGVLTHSRPSGLTCGRSMEAMLRIAIAALTALILVLPAHAGEVTPHPLGKCISTVSPGSEPEVLCWHMVFVGELARD